MTRSVDVKGPHVLFRILPHGEGLPVPDYKTEHSVGMDIPAAVEDDLYLAPGDRAMIPTGLQIAVPVGYEAQVRPRSGLSAKHGIIIPNSPGTVDPDYRGEVKVILMNLGQESFKVSRGMRIAQLVIVPAVQATLEKVDHLPDTERGKGGFGHTGV